MWNARVGAHGLEMDRRRFLGVLGAGALGCLGAGKAWGERPARQPNILFILSDDQSHEALHALGTREVHTPNLDRLVAGGTAFTHAYNPGGWHGAICVASRTMLQTGAGLWRARELDRRLGPEVEAGRLWPQRMKAAGYETYYAGKWHVNVDAERAFDEVRHVRPGMPPETPALYNRPVEGQPDAWSPFDPAQGGFWEGGRHWSEVVADDGEAFLARAAARDAPFFMCLAFNAPHDPRQSPKRWVDHYPLEEVAVPGNFLPNYPDDVAIGCDPTVLRDERLAPSPRTEHAVRVHRQEYYAIVSHMDEQVGRILDALDRSGRREDTIVVFTSDHGLAVGRHGFMGKQNMYDHSMRVPLVVQGPGIAAGRRIDAPVYMQDVVPTTLAWAGASAEGMDFRPLQGLLAGTRDRQYDAIYGAYMNLQRMVVMDRHKLIHYPKLGKTLLFDLEADPDETANLAGRESHADTEQRLATALASLQQAWGDPLDSQ